MFRIYDKALVFFSLKYLEQKVPRTLLLSSNVIMFFHENIVYCFTHELYTSNIFSSTTIIFID